MVAIAPRLQGLSAGLVRRQIRQATHASLRCRCHHTASLTAPQPQPPQPASPAATTRPWLPLGLLPKQRGRVSGAVPARYMATRAAAAYVDGPAGPGGPGDGGSGGNGGGGGDGDPPPDNSGEGGQQPEEQPQGEVILTLKQVETLCQEKGVALPADMLQVAAKYGLRLSVLNAFFAVQGTLLSGAIARALPYFRDRILADHMFLFKVGAEVVIDSGCATIAEVRKRGDDFWAEFEFYLSDLVVGLVMDVALVSLMAPAAVLGGASKAAMSTGWLAKTLARVPSAFFEASVPGVKTYSLAARLACLLVKFGEYSLAGMACGLVGQGVCNAVMNLKRHVHGTKEDDVAVPPLVKTALVWGLFMGVSANVRYQIVFGLERLVDLTIARAVPSAAYFTTLGIRFTNNVIGGENFIDMARWAGVQ